MSEHRSSRFILILIILAAAAAVYLLLEAEDAWDYNKRVYQKATHLISLKAQQ